MILGIAHIAIAVEKIDPALKLWRDDLQLRYDGCELVGSEGVKTAFLSLEDSNKNKIELLEPSTKESPVAKFIQRKGSGGIHHIAFLVDDLEKEIKNLTQKGYRFVDAKPRSGANRSKIAFLHPKSAHGVLIELVQQGGP